MLLWANKKEINMKIIKPIEVMYGDGLGVESLSIYMKAWELSIIYKQIQEHFGSRRDISILDFGAGASPFGAYLNHIGYQDVTCLDKPRTWHPEMNEETYNKKFNANVKYLNMNIVHGYDGEHDVIFSASVLEHIGDRGIKVIPMLSECLKSGGLFIHVADYGQSINFKTLIDSCSIPISYKAEETPGCKEYKTPPEYAWMEWHEKEKRWISRIAFFNERNSSD